MKGQIKIRIGNDNQEPMIVYIKNWHNYFEKWICEKINSGDTVFSNNDQLIDFDYDEYKRMYYEWKIKQQDIIKQRFIELLNDFNKK